MDISRQKQRVYQAISNFFPELVVTKIKQTGNYGMYYAKVSMNTSLEDQYIVVIVEENEATLGTQMPLERLLWVSLQTRTLLEPPIEGMPSQNVGDSVITPVLKAAIEKSSFTDTKSTYFCNDFPLKIELLHTQTCRDDVCNINTTEEYNKKGTLLMALKTFNCVLSFTL